MKNENKYINNSFETKDTPDKINVEEFHVVSKTNNNDNDFYSSLGNFTDDVFEAIEQNRKEDFTDIPREIL